MTHSFDKSYWDGVWSGDRAASMSTSRPNPHLIKEVGGLEPGTAIDAGCGAGAEAIWLATRGWKVTAADVADAALVFAEERAGAAGLGGLVHWVRADLSTWEPDVQYDLVTTHYAHPEMPQLDFYVRLASWVAPGGTLLIVGHLHHRPTRDEPRGHGHGHSQPPVEASATAAAITDRLDPTDWEIVTAEESQRATTGPGDTSTTLHDVVVRAVRQH